MGLPQIVINGRFLSAPPSGVRRYAWEIACRLEGRARLSRPPRSAGRLGSNLWEQLFLPRRIPPGALLWSPANSGPLGVSHQVVTIHDVAALEHPEWFKPEFAAWYGRMLPRLAQHARLILTVSSHSKERIVAVLKVPYDKVEVITPGVGADFRQAQPERIAAVRRTYGLAPRSLLWVGTLEPRKNLPRLLEAWTRIQPLHPQTELLLCGAAGSSFRRVTLDALPPATRCLGRIPDQDLPALYSASEILLLPSLYEGFGLPALEAMACGTAVIASRAAAAAQVFEHAILAVDPQDADQIAAAIQRLLEDPGLRSELSRRGSEQAATYTWERTARLVHAALLRAAQAAGAPAQGIAI